VILYFWVLFATLFSRKRLGEDDTPAIPFGRTVEMRSEGVMRVLDNLTAWFALACLLVAVAYGPTLVSMIFDQVPMPGLRLW
jgi:hypothetical protein